MSNHKKHRNSAESEPSGLEREPKSKVVSHQKNEKLEKWVRECSAKSVKQIIRWLDKNPEGFGYQDEEGASILILALQNDHRNNRSELLELVDFLMHQTSLDINLRSHNKASALMWAVYYNQLEIVERLIHKGANVNHQDENGNTALIFVAESMSNFTAQSEEILHRLIDAGINLNHANDAGANALVQAAEAQCFPMIKKLVEAGALIEGRSELEVPLLELRRLTPEALNYLQGAKIAREELKVLSAQTQALPIAEAEGLKEPGSLEGESVKRLQKKSKNRL